MNLSDLKVLYNTLNKKLLLFTSILNVLNHMIKIDQEMFFLDPEFFNPLFTYQENTIIKERLSRALNYNGPIVFGDQIGTFLYKRKEDKTEYTVGGLLKRNDIYTYVYKYLPTKYQTIIKRKLSSISKFVFSYTIEALLTYTYEKESNFFHNFLYRAYPIDSSRVKIVLADPEYNKFDDLLKVFKNIPISTVKISIEKHPSENTLKKEVILKYGLFD